MLKDDAKQQLALQYYLSQLYNDQIVFGVKQRELKTIEVAMELPWNWSHIWYNIVHQIQLFWYQ